MSMTTTFIAATASAPAGRAGSGALGSADGSSARGTAAAPGTRSTRHAHEASASRASASLPEGEKDAGPRRGFSEVMARERSPSGDDAGGDAGGDAAVAGRDDAASPAGSGVEAAAGRGPSGAPLRTDHSGEEAADTTLDQSLAALLDGTLGPAADTGSAGAQVKAASTQLVGQAEADTHGDAAMNSDSSGQTLPAWFLSTLLPTVMPPAPLRSAAAVLPAAEAPEGASTSASALSGAVAADAAQMLSLKSQDTTDSASDSSAIRLPEGNAATAGDRSAWAGLQRWSAAVMDASPLSLPAASLRTGSDPVLAMPDQRQDWHNSLMQALGDRLQLQAVQRSESARLHLMPPQWGRIEIDIRQQGGALQVQLSATHDEVRQQLRQIAEPLRQDLVQRHAGEVSVQVASGATASGDGRGRDGAASGQHPPGQNGQSGQNGQNSPSGQGGQRDAQRQPGRAWETHARVEADGFGDALAREAQG